MTPTPAAAETDAWLDALRRLSVEDMLLPVLLQLGLIILAARLFAVLFRRLGQPSVVGEIAAGLFLGPSLLGSRWLAALPGGDFFHEQVYNGVFHPAVGELGPALSDQVLGWMLTLLSQLGLVFLLFLIGLEFDFGHLRRQGKSALAISLAGIALPFALGLAIAPVLRPFVGDVDPVGFALFLGTALAITAIPVLGRILMELNVTRTRLGAITISAAAVDDAAGWVLLATVAAVVRAEFSPWKTAAMAGETVAFVLAMVFVARPLLRRWARRALRPGDGEISVNGLAVLLAVLFACAIATNLIGIFAVFGAFLLGAVLSGEHQFRRAVARRLRDFVTAFFLPIFFAYTGLRTDLGSLGTWQLWLLCGLVLAAAVVGKLAGCGLAAWLAGHTPREAACVGAMMNTRGLMALVVINLGKSLGVIPDSVFCMLVLMALATTLMTTPLLLRLMRGTELEANVLQSGFGGRQAAAGGVRFAGEGVAPAAPRALSPAAGGEAPGDL
ncbi:MAG TPA: cation:proton antiporter [Gemmataceae bacterium]|nr:cation:proton antiporter [Gemmataceae bacterium]